VLLLADKHKFLGSNQNITSLAKAQDIVIKLLLMLSNSDREIAGIVSDLSDKLYDIIKTTGKIAQEVVDIDNLVKYGYQRSMMITEFPDSKKSVLLSALNYVVDKYEKNERLAIFLTAVRKMARYNEINSHFNIDTFNFNDKESKVVFPILIELNYVCKGDMSLCSEISEMIDCLNISSMSKKILKRQVELDIGRIGIDGIIELYNDIAQEYHIDDSDIEFEVQSESNSNLDHSPRELTDLQVNDTFSVQEGEVMFPLPHNVSKLTVLPVPG
jgi:hypothetical protein